MEKEDGQTLSRYQPGIHRHSSWLSPKWVDVNLSIWLLQQNHVDGRRRNRNQLGIETETTNLSIRLLLLHLLPSTLVWSVDAWDGEGVRVSE